MGFMKSLGRGVDTGAQNYVRQRLMAQKREDALTQREEEKRRYEEQRAAREKERRENTLVRMLTLATSTNNPQAIQSVGSQMEAEGMLPEYQRPAPEAVKPLEEFDDTTPYYGENKGVSDRDFEAMLREGDAIQTPEMLEAERRAQLHPITAGLMDVAETNRVNQELQATQYKISSEQAALNLSEAKRKANAGEIKQLGGKHFIVYPSIDGSGAPRIESLPAILESQINSDENGWEIKAVSTSDASIVYQNKFTNKTKTVIDPTLVQASVESDERDIEKARLIEENRRKGINQTQSIAHQNRLRLAGIGDARSMRDTIVKGVMNGSMTPENAQDYIMAGMGAYEGTEVPTTAFQALSQMVNDFGAGRLPLKFSEGEKKQLEGVYYVQTASARLLELLEDPEVSDYVGRISGTVQEVQNILTGQATSNPKLTEFAATLQDLKKGILYARSGQAASEAEHQSYERLVGTTLIDKDALKGRLKVAAHHSQTQREGIYRVNLGVLHRQDKAKVAKDWNRVPKLWHKLDPALDTTINDNTNDPWSTSDEDLQ